MVAPGTANAVPTKSDDARHKKRMRALAQATDQSDKENSKSSTAPKPATPKPATPQPAAAQPAPRFDIDEYRVEGADALPQMDVEEAVYPFLGPGRTADDVEKARAALEKAYQGKGYQTVAVTIPPQDARTGVVVFKVVEAKVGRLRVKNSRYFDIEKVKEKAPSVAEGKLPNFNQVTKDIVSLNQWPDRKVTPSLRAGVTPGTVDVDLNVEDKLPFHASVELNNRQSPNTTPTRFTATAHYDNLWQRGDSFSFTYQIAPQRRQDAEVFSGSYLARTDLDWLNFLLYAVKSNSNVSSVGAQNVIGPGTIVGARAVATLPMRENYYHTVSFGWDYKRFEQEIIPTNGPILTVQDGQSPPSVPITYYPVTGVYSGTLTTEGASTAFNVGFTAGVRGLGNDQPQFDQKRPGADANFVYLRGDISHTHELPEKWQFYTKIQGQLSDQALVNSEQFTAAGADYVRGYYDSEVLGDSGIVGTVEFRTPDVATQMVLPKDDKGQPARAVVNEWRFFVFTDLAKTRVIHALPNQSRNFWLGSYGVGTRIKFLDYMNGMVAFAMPTTDQQFTQANDPHVLFRVWGEF